MIIMPDDRYRFFIHHDEATGRDMRFASEPDIPHFLTIDLIGDVEQTYTRGVRTMVGPWPAIIQPKPRGAGWTLHEDHDSHAVWRRPNDAKVHAEPANWPGGSTRPSSSTPPDARAELWVP